MYMDWAGVNSMIYPEYNEILDQYIKQNDIIRISYSSLLNGYDKLGSQQISNMNAVFYFYKKKT